MRLTLRHSIVKDSEGIMPYPVMRFIQLQFLSHIFQNFLPKDIFFEPKTHIFAQNFKTGNEL
jgi:hypothetical protein